MYVFLISTVSVNALFTSNSLNIKRNPVFDAIISIIKHHEILNGLRVWTKSFAIHIFKLWIFIVFEARNIKHFICADHHLSTEDLFISFLSPSYFRLESYVPIELIEFYGWSSLCPSSLVKFKNFLNLMVSNLRQTLLIAIKELKLNLRDKIVVRDTQIVKSSVIEGVHNYLSTKRV